MVLSVWLCRREDLREGGMETPLTSPVEAVPPRSNRSKSLCTGTRHFVSPHPWLL